MLIFWFGSLCCCIREWSCFKKYTMKFLEVKGQQYTCNLLSSVSEKYMCVYVIHAVDVMYTWYMDTLMLIRREREKIMVKCKHLLTLCCEEHTEVLYTIITTFLYKSEVFQSKFEILKKWKMYIKYSTLPDTLVNLVNLDFCYSFWV